MAGQNRDDIEPQDEEGAAGGHDVYDELATEEPERPIEISLPVSPSGVAGAPMSLSDAENSPDISDLQVTLKYLFPDFKDTILAKVTQSVRSIMFSRVTPDMILAQMALTITSIVDRMDAYKEDIDVQAIINMVSTAFEIGLEGRGRAEIVQLYGAQKEAAELEAVTKGLGLS